jgi:PBP1b-binding outer membrane lipoprotein LpoB
MGWNRRRLVASNIGFGMCGLVDRTCADLPFGGGVGVAMESRRVKVLMVAGVSGMAAMLGGCQPPIGDSGGRVEVTDTTRAERNDPRVLPTALFESSDAIAQQLASDLKSVPELNGEYRSTVVFGDIMNKTGIVSTTDFEAFRTRIRQQLMQSQNVLRNVRFVEMKQRIDPLIQRETSKSKDLLQEGTRPERKDLNPAYTYFLNGEMYRVERGGSKSNTYLMSYNLTNMETGEIIWTNAPYEVKQVVGR